MSGMAADLPDHLPELRASDADRERVAEVLRTAAAEGRIDLREASFAAPEVEIRLFAMMGGFEVVVPEDAEVIISGVGIMGGFDDRAAGGGGPGAVRIKITGLAFWGGVDVKRLPPQEEL